MAQPLQSIALDGLNIAPDTQGITAVPPSITLDGLNIVADTQNIIVAPESITADGLNSVAEAGAIALDGYKLTGNLFQN